MQVDRASWIRWLVSRIRSYTDKLGGGWERDELQRTAKRHDDDGDDKDVGLRILLLAAVIMAERALPPQNNRLQMTKKRNKYREKNLAALRRVIGPLLSNNFPPPYFPLFSMENRKKYPHFGN